MDLSHEPAARSTAETHNCLLPDNRNLTYLTHGSPLSTATSLLYIHGSPGGPTESLFLSTAAISLNLRIIAPARPGSSTSTPLYGRTISSYTLDIHALLTHLHLSSIHILAVSAGSPYALALAHSPLTESYVRTITLVAGIGPKDLGTAGMDPINRILCFLLRWWPSLVVEWVRSCGYARSETPSAVHYADEFMDRLKVSTAAGNYLWEDEWLVSTLKRAVEEGFAQGPEEMVLDAGLGAREWGFSVQDVRTERDVRLWYSKADGNVPVRIGRELGKMLGKAKLREFDDDGHIDICIRHAEEILRGVLED